MFSLFFLLTEISRSFSHKYAPLFPKSIENQIDLVNRHANRPNGSSSKPQVNKNKTCIDREQKKFVFLFLYLFALLFTSFSLLFLSFNDDLSANMFQTVNPNKNSKSKK